MVIQTRIFKSPENVISCSYSNSWSDDWCYVKAAPLMYFFLTEIISDIEIEKGCNLHILLIAGYILIRLQARKYSHKVADQPKEVRCTSTPTDIAQQIMYCHLSHGWQWDSVLNILLSGHRRKKCRFAGILSVLA